MNSRASAVFAALLAFGLLVAQYVSAQHCLGVTVNYAITRIIDFPSVWNGTHKPFGFRATLRLTNTGKKDLEGWTIAIKFARNELITAVTGLQTDATLPAYGRNLQFVGIPSFSDTVVTAIDAGGDPSLYVVTAQIAGTEFGASTPQEALPEGIELIQKGYKCAPSAPSLHSSNGISTCCHEIAPHPPPPAPPLANDLAHPGAIEVTFDLTWLGINDYWFLVSMKNEQISSRVTPPGWALTWTWNRQEFIWEAHGAQATNQGDCLDSPAASAALFGPQIQTAHTCMTRPTFKDLSFDLYYSASSSNSFVNNVQLSCCKNGTLGINSFPWGDPAFASIPGNASLAQFSIRVSQPKMKIALTDVSPPSAMSLGIPGFKCGPPIRTEPSAFKVNPDRVVNAGRTWKYLCLRVKQPSPPTCCVSLSAAFNTSKSPPEYLATRGSAPFFVAPCPVCACGCTPPANTPFSNDNTCPTTDGFFYPRITSPGDFTPYPVLAKPYGTPSCGDSCPIHVHWHVMNVYKDGFLTKLTIINRNSTAVPYWFAAISMPAFENVSSVYSFLNVSLNNESLLLWGYQSSNDWLLGTDGKGRSFGSVSTIIKFGMPRWMNITKDKGVALFPSHVVIDGELCSMPDYVPFYTPPQSKRFLLPTIYIALIGAIGLCGVLAMSFAYI